MNKHDLIAASIVAGAIESKNLPPRARAAVAAAIKTFGPTLAAEQQAQPAEPAATGQAQTASELSELAGIAANRMRRDQCAIVDGLLKDNPATYESTRDWLVAEGDLKVFRNVDESTDWELHGVLLVRFFPAEIAVTENGGMLVNLRYLLA